MTLRQSGAALACVAAMVWAPSAHGQVAPARLSALATEPDWSKLEGYQGTISREEFVRLLDTVYAPNGAWKNTITIADDGAHILTTGTNRWVLTFREDRIADDNNFRGLAPHTPPYYWRPIAAMPVKARPLEGIKIA